MWGLPGGHCEVGLSPAENVVKEVLEETGYEVSVTRLLALLDPQKRSDVHYAVHSYHPFFLCEITGGSPRTSIETTDVRFFSLDELPYLSLSYLDNGTLKELCNSARTGAAWFD